MQKAFLFLIISLLLLLTACTTASITPTSTTKVINTATYTPTNTLMPFPTATATITPTSTPAISDLYYPGLAPTIEIFELHQVERSQIKNIIADLRSKPSLLGTDAMPFGIGKGGTSAAKIISVICNVNALNCAPAASISIFELGAFRDIIIFEVVNADNTRGYITGFFNDNIELRSLDSRELLLQNPTNFLTMNIFRETTEELKYYTNFPHIYGLMHQDGYENFIDAIFQTGIIPKMHEDMILVLIF